MPEKRNKGSLTVSDKIDRIVTNRVLALPIFAAIMVVVYYVSVTSIGTIFTDWMNDGVFGDGWHLFGNGTEEYETAMDEYADERLFTPELLDMVRAASSSGVVGAEEILAAAGEGLYAGFEEAYGSYGAMLAEAGYDLSAVVDAALDETTNDIPAAEDYGIWVPGIPALAESGLDAIRCADWLKSLILDGIIAGVGAVLGFVPQILVLFIFLAFLESCGYMARIAFVMDRIFRRFGLSGKSFIPMLIGSGCGVPESWRPGRLKTNATDE